MSSAPTPTPAYYPVNDTARSEAERAYLQKLADRAAEQNLSEDLRKYVRDTSIAFTVFAGVFVGLRFLARHRQAARIGVDDYLMVAALLVLVGNMIMNLQLVDQGLGLHSGMLTLPELQRLDQVCSGLQPRPPPPFPRELVSTVADCLPWARTDHRWRRDPLRHRSQPLQALAALLLLPRLPGAPGAHRRVHLRRHLDGVEHRLRPGRHLSYELLPAAPQTPSPSIFAGLTRYRGQNARHASGCGCPGSRERASTSS